MEDMAVASIQVTETPLVLYALRRADDALILGHRLSEWCGHAPAMEEDMALANMGLDMLGQARELYSYAAKVEARGNDEDKFAYLRDVRQYRNLLLLEQPNGDFARTLVRQFFYAAFADLYWRAMMKSSDATLAAVAAKSEKETAYHLRHSSEWVVRLGDGTEESHRRAQGAVDDLWAFTGEMFHVDESELELIESGVAVDPATLRPQWLKTVSNVVSEATLALPTSAAGRPQRPPQRASRPSAQRTAIDAADISGGHMVIAMLNDADLRQRAWDAAAAVVDPEIPVLTIADLGVLRDVAVTDGRVEVAITPTYSGCPAMNMIALEIEIALEREGIPHSKVRTVLSPAWTTDWMSEQGRQKLKEYGIAPPQPASSRRALFGVQQVVCPQCGSGDTEVLSEFGSTSCKALWRCRNCREPFDYFKCH
jgi:ring-1,2-phenylacetyl-CoA epoxidase subunit PaaC